MASSSSTSGHCLLLALFFLLSAAYGQLSQDFYAKSCSSLEDTIRSEVSHALFDPAPAGERRMGASLLRLFFHDCFPQGCDASVLLDDDAQRGIVSEKNAGPNANSLRGFEVIDRIKMAVEAKCPGVVSCADILALTTRQAVVQLGGQSWTLLLGRRDSMNANLDKANSDLPGPESSLAELTTSFGRKGFSPSELVALSGGHTIGSAHCNFVDNTIRQFQCQIGDPVSQLAPLDEKTPDKFDNNYYGNLLRNRGLLHSDQVLMDGGDLEALVGRYSSGTANFRGDFASAMKKMSETSLLTGANGQIRANCRRLN